MSVEDEIELRDLVAQTLETNGCLAKIRAQLRAGIFLALDEDVKISQQQPLLNNKVKAHLETEVGRTMFGVVREFLEFFNLHFTLSVFDPESYNDSGYKYEGRQKITKDLGLDNLEDKTVPVLLQLIKIAQTKRKSLQINLDVNKHDIENNSITQDNTTSNMNKTDSDSMSLHEVNVDEEKNASIESSPLLPGILNSTFDVTSPTINFNIKKTENVILKAQTEDPQNRVIDGTHNTVCNKREERDDDTYGDTSSIAEDSVVVNSDNNLIVPELTLNGIEENTLNESVSDKVSHPILKESKAMDKPKQKSDKLKSKNSLNNLSDLPPLTINKSRVNDILPSLYSKEFKDKSNLRELDKLFDMEAEYEEDFICSGDDLSLKSDYMKSESSKLLDDMQPSSKSVNPESFPMRRDTTQKVTNRMVSDCNKFPPLANNSKTTEVFSSTGAANNSESSSSTVSEDLGNHTVD